jgi:hypothetical protein
MTSKTTVSLDNGKYKITMKDYSESNPYSFTVTHNDEPWRDLASEGDNLLFRLLRNYEAMRDERDVLQTYIDTKQLAIAHSDRCIDKQLAITRVNECIQKWHQGWHSHLLDADYFIHLSDDGNRFCITSYSKPAITPVINPCRSNALATKVINECKADLLLILRN